MRSTKQSKSPFHQPTPTANKNVSFLPERHGGHRLRPAHAQQRVGTRNVRGSHCRCRWSRRRHHNSTNSRGPGRYGRHDHGRRERVTPPRRVATSYRHGADSVAGVPSRNADGNVSKCTALGFGKGFHTVLCLGISGVCVCGGGGVGVFVRGWSVS